MATYGAKPFNLLDQSYFLIKILVIKFEKN